MGSEDKSIIDTIVELLVVYISRSLGLEYYYLSERLGAG
jgi:hypothetical protein